MDSWKILFPVDFSSAARTAAPTVARLASTLHGSVVTLAVVVGTAPAAEVTAAKSSTDRERMRSWLEPDLGSIPLDPHIRYGLPGVEISRHAEESSADLVVLVGKRRSPQARLSVGDTVDAVIRRSTVPCLILHAGLPDPRGIVVALDGTDRGLRVFTAAERLAAAAGWRLEILSVDPHREGEPATLAAAIPSTRRETLLEGLSRLQGGEGNRSAVPIMIRRGNVVDEILREMSGRAGEVLAIGYRRGGPPGILEAGNIARQVVHRVEGPVLTVPL